MALFVVVAVVVAKPQLPVHAARFASADVRWTMFVVIESLAR